MVNIYILMVSFPISQARLDGSISSDEHRSHHQKSSIGERMRLDALIAINQLVRLLFRCAGPLSFNRISHTVLCYLLERENH